jgi:hypothetical protein
MFEWCSPKQQIKVCYGEDKLTLLAVRDNVTGVYMPTDMMRAGETPMNPHP